jgi:putative ABC transport system substrate-binding protein
MKKNNYVLVVVLAIVVVSATLLLIKQYNNRSALSVVDFNIALCAPAVHPAMEDIFKGFKETIRKESNKKYAFTEYNANGNKTLLRGQADEILSAGYDLVFTIGATCSQTAFELSRKKNDDLPIVFSAIDDPVGMGIVASMESSGNNVTGVISTSLYQEQIDALLLLKPSTQNILLVYDPAHGSGLEKEKTILQELLRTRNINLHAVEISNANEIMQKVSSVLESIDVILILTDHTAVTGVPTLVTLCNRYGITLYASDLNSGHKGAALSFGVLEYDYGRVAAPLAISILEDKVAPAQLPIVRMNQQYIQLNSATTKAQGLSLSDSDLAALKARGGIII